MPIPSHTPSAPETRLEQVLDHLELCREVAPLIGDTALSEHLRAAFDICLERFCELKRARLESRIAETPRH